MDTCTTSLCAGHCTAWACALPALPPCRLSGETPPVALVTGSNRGVGLGVAKVLVRRGWTTWLLCRDDTSAAKAASALRCEPGAIEVRHFDLADIASMRRIANELRTRGVRVGCVVNNAAEVSSNCVQTNHLGHFAWTLLILDLLATDAVILHVASCVHAAFSGSFLDDACRAPVSASMSLPVSSAATPREPSIAADTTKTTSRAAEASDAAPLGHTIAAEASHAPVPARTPLPAFESSPATAVASSRDPWAEYTRSKAANVLFTLALSRRLVRAGHTARAVCCHPGVLPTRLWSFAYPTASSSEDLETDHAATLRRLDAWGAPDLLPLHCACCKSARTASAGVAFLAASGATTGHALGCCSVPPALVPRAARRAAVRSGGYYQQLCCCCSVPTRAAAPMYDVAQQEALWSWSVRKLHQTSEGGGEGGVWGEIERVADAAGVGVAPTITDPPDDEIAAAADPVGWRGSVLLTYAAASPLACLC